MRARTKVLSLIVILALVSACAPKAPTYSPQAQRAANAHQLLQEVTALSATVVNLNALPAGAPGKLSDDDTRLVRDFALAVADGVPPYVSTNVIAGLQTAYTSLSQRLSANAKVAPQVKAALALVTTQLQLIGVVVAAQQ